MADEAPELAQMLPKASHKKSRLGCTNCKVRKVKCDESHPVCRACRLRRTKCEYGPVLLRKKLSLSSSTETSMISASRSSRSSLANLDAKRMTSIPQAPSMSFPMVDGVDMKLLWFYTSATYKSLSYADKQQSSMNDMLQTVVVQHAFEAPFLMDSLLELASLHMQSLGLASDARRALTYRVRSFEGYRKAIEDASPKEYGALLANSVLRPILSTQAFRDPDCKDLYLLNWMRLFQGIRSIIEITSVPSIANSGMLPLFNRPSLNPETSITAIPKQLLLMVSFISFNEEDALDLQTYQESLCALGSLFESLPKEDMSSTMLLRIITWSTVIPPRLLELAEMGRPRALVIIAHYATFLKLPQDVWWLVGVGDRSITDICRALGPPWYRFLRIPLSVSLIGTIPEMKSLILNREDEQ